MLRFLTRSTLSRAFALTTPSTTRTLSIAAGGYGKTLTRPTIAAAVTQSQNGGIMEQVRGMKVRASVKKMCEGCKVRDCDLDSEEKGDVEWWLDVVPKSWEEDEVTTVFCGR